ncbi:MAG TPA: FtsX-like permease family protein [Gemmatimonadales bacterium]|nr:FtsX-like permease family protein [Gemmatimonadales bacterium]
MTGAGAVLRLSWRETRASRRRLLLFASAISIGVAALVAIRSFTANVQESVHRQARELLGADLLLTSNRPFTPPVESLLDSLARGGAVVARRTSLNSMAYVRRREGTRLVDVRAVGGGFPFYGRAVTDPPNRWADLDTAEVAVVDTSLLVQLGARIGDTLELGRRSFRIAAVAVEVPGRLSGGYGSFVPEVYIPVRDVAGTGLVVFGSRASYQALLKLDGEKAARRLDGSHKRLFEREKVRSRSAGDAEANLTESLSQLSSFLQFVGLVALLLGGIGVASGIGAFVAGKLDTIAVLRCLGAGRPAVFVIYLLQAAALGLVAAAAGAALGVGVQFLLPVLLKGVLPLGVSVTVEPAAVAAGLAVGVAVAVLFALRPLLEVRLVSPLQALRQPFEDEAVRPPRDPWRVAAFGALAVGVVALAMNQSDEPRVGLGFAVAIGLSLGVLTLTARVAIALARRLLVAAARGAGWPYALRQGIANLYRPRNQTRTVVVALGFGVALLATLYLVEANLLGQVQFATLATPGKPNLVFVDIQPDQEAGVDSLVRASGAGVLQQVPIVPMRIASINGRAPDDLLRDPKRRPPAPWTLRREYRSTFRDSMTAGERLVRGAWWHGRGAGPPYPVSLSSDVAQDLGVGIGDRIDWTVEGLSVPTAVVALREVEWARFEPNFFAVFSSAALAGVPRSTVVLTRLDDAAARARLQRAVSARYANVTSFDVALVQAVVERILGRVSLAIRFMAAFSLAIGALVLAGAVAAGRLARIREGALLKTLGATRRQLSRILLAEYLALGTLAGLVGIGLSALGAWAMVHFVFDLGFKLPAVPLLAVLAATAALVAAVGLAASREVFRRTAMEVLRES